MENDQNRLIIALAETEESQPNTVESTIESKYTKNGLFLWVLIILNLLNYVDRFTVAGTLIDIQHDYKINDSESGLIITVFVCFYMISAPIFGYCGDRYNRKLLICFGLTIWIVAVLCSSFSENFYVFLSLRALVGVGEAAYATIAPTLISDLFSDSARSRCLMLFYAAMPVGSGLGYIVGSTVDYSTGSWRWGLRVTPVIGIIFLGITLLFFDEPARGQADCVHGQETAYQEDLRSLWKIRTFVFVTLGFTGVSFVLGSMSWWTPTICEYAWACLNGDFDVPDIIKASIATTFGLLSCFGGLIGVIVGATIARVCKHGLTGLPPPFDSQEISPYGPRADTLVCALGALLAVPIMWLALFTIAKSMFLGWIFIFMAIVLAVSNMAVTTDVILYVTPPTRRGTAIAIQTLCVHLLGDATSPYFVGVTSDFFRGGQKSSISRFNALQYALFIPNAVLIIGAFFYFRATAHVEKDAERNTFLMHEANPPTILDEDGGEFIHSVIGRHQTDIVENP